MLLLQQKVTEEAWLVKEKLRVEVENGQVGDAGWWGWLGGGWWMVLKLINL